MCVMMVLMNWNIIILFCGITVLCLMVYLLSTAIIWGFVLYIHRSTLPPSSPARQPTHKRTQPMVMCVSGHTFNKFDIPTYICHTVTIKKKRFTRKGRHNTRAHCPQSTVELSNSFSRVHWYSQSKMNGSVGITNNLVTTAPLLNIFDTCLTVHHWYKRYRQPTRCNNNSLLIIPISSTRFGR